MPPNPLTLPTQCLLSYVVNPILNLVSISHRNGTFPLFRLFWQFVTNVKTFLFFYLWHENPRSIFTQRPTRIFPQGHIQPHNTREPGKFGVGLEHKTWEQTTHPICQWTIPTRVYENTKIEYIRIYKVVSILYTLLFPLHARLCGAH